MSSSQFVHSCSDSFTSIPCELSHVEANQGKKEPAREGESYAVVASMTY
jgi:hypothetical protein